MKDVLFDIKQELWLLAKRNKNIPRYCYVMKHMAVLFNTLRPRQNGRHFSDDIFKCIFLNENVWLLVKVWMKFVPKGPTNTIAALVHIMAWRRPGNNHCLNQWCLVYWRIYPSLGLTEFTHTGLIIRTNILRHFEMTFCKES